MKQLIVQSHGGAGTLAPENTLESFVATWELGAIPEADLRTTRDGVIVAFHDKNFARVVKDASPELRDKGVANVTFEELRTLDVGSWRGESFAGQRVPGIEAIFASMPEYSGRALYLDIKDVDLAQLAELTRKYRVAEKVILAAPQEALLREWKTLVPKGQTLLWMGIIWQGDEATLSSRLGKLRASEFAGITQLQIHVEATRDGEAWKFKPSLAFLRAVADELRARGILFQTLPWNCAEVEVYRALLQVGVQSFASDYPEIALNVLSEAQKQAATVA